MRDEIQKKGFNTLIIDVGIHDNALITPDISANDVAAYGHIDLNELIQHHDRGLAVSKMGDAAEAAISDLYEKGTFSAILALGGSGGTSIACRAMRALPLDIPKIMVSTMAGSDVSQYVGASNIIMFPSMVDIAGINEISQRVFSNAAAAICAMAACEVTKKNNKPLIAASMFGNTTRGVTHAKELLEAEGYEVLIFHATGAGGKTMESLIATGHITAVFDITTTELADELLGGVLSAGADRLNAAVENNIPAIVVPGCLDMVNFGAPNTIPAALSDRLFYQHNPDITLMRSNIEENKALGTIIADKLNRSTAPVTVLLPTQGLSELDVNGGTFWWPEADEALFSAIRNTLSPHITLIECAHDINDEIFITHCVNHLLKNIKASSCGHP